MPATRDSKHPTWSPETLSHVADADGIYRPPGGDGLLELAHERQAEFSRRGARSSVRSLTSFCAIAVPVHASTTMTSPVTLRMIFAPSFSEPGFPR